MSYDSFFLLVLMVIFEISLADSHYKIVTKHLATTASDIQGIFYTDKGVYTFTKGDKIYKTDLDTELSQTLKNNPIKISPLSLKLKQLTKGQIIIAFGEELIYFVDEELNKIGKGIGYAEVGIEESKIDGSTTFEVNESEGDDSVEILLGYPIYQKTSKDYKVFFQLYQAHSSTLEITQTSSSFYLPDVFNDIEKNYLGCRFLEKGLTIFCAFLDASKIIKIGFIDKEFSKIENIQEYAKDVKEFKLLKINDNLVSISYYRTTGGLITSINSLCITGYKIKNREFFQKTSQEISLKKELTFRSNSFAAASLGSGSVIILENSSNLGYYIIKFFDFPDEELTSSLKSQDLSKIIGKILNPSVLFVTDIGNNPENGAIIAIFIGLELYLTLIKSYPVCNENNFYYLVSNNIEKFDLSKLASPKDENYIRITNIQKLQESVEKGSILYSSETGFEYQTDNNGKSFIEYYLTDKDNEVFTSPACRIYLNVCNKACGQCTEFQHDSLYTTCTYCADDYAPLIDKQSQCSLKSEEYIDGYYYEKTENSFLNCHENCLQCTGKGTNDIPNCSKCKVGFELNNNLKLCEIKNQSCNIKQSNWYYDTTNHVNVCVTFCPDSFPYFVQETNECVVTCPKKEYNKIFEHLCLRKCPSGAIEMDSICKFNSIHDIVENIDEIILLLKKAKPVGSLSNSTYEIYNTSVGSEIPSLMMNVSTIELGDCEAKLKQANGIPEDEHLLIFKVDIAREGQVTNQVEYKVYRKDGKRLDLSICKDLNITISTPINEKEVSTIELDKAKYLAEQGYDMYDPNSNFYNDVCTPFTSQNGTDMIITDRKKDLFKNVSFCEAGCNYTGINFTTNRVNCSCKIKTEISEARPEFSFQKFGESFTKLISGSNIKIFKCYKVVFNASKLVHNILNWVVLSIAIVEIVLISFYIKIEIKPLRTIVNFFLERNKDNHNCSTTESNQGQRVTEVIPIGSASSPVKSNSKVIVLSQNSDTQLQKDEFTSIESNDKINNRHSEKKKKTQKKIADVVPKKIFVSKISDNEKQETGDNSNKELIQVISIEDPMKSKEKLIKESSKGESSSNKKEEEKEKKEIMSMNKYTDEEINGMEFEDALKYDQRSLCRYYFSILKYDQSILFSFFTNTDYNMKIFKISMFIFSFSLYLTYNALFYSDSTMTHNYQNAGKYDFIYGLPSTFFAFLCCFGTNCLLSFLALSQPQIQKIKEEKDIEKAKKFSDKFVKCFKIKISLFFTLVMFFLGLFWYYDSAFGAIFPNTQRNLLIDTLISFIMCMLYPFALCLITTFIRYLALKKHWKKLFCFLYWFMNWFGNVIQAF